MSGVDNMRAILGNFATGVTVVTFPDRRKGLTANAFSSVSLDPPLVLVCVDHDTDTYNILHNQGVNSFCVNVLANDQQHLGEYFANMNDLEEDPFDGEPTATEATGATIFTDSLAYLDCEVWEAVPAGDHTIYIGEIQVADILNEEAKALTFFRGEWGELP